MKRVCAAIGVLAFFGLMGMPLGAETVDFSGTWSLNRDASEVPEFPGRGGPGGGGGQGGRGGPGGRGGGGFGGPAETVVITQDGDQLVIQEQSGDRSRSVTYFLDGRESVDETGRGVRKTTSSWDGATLVTEGSFEISTPRGDFTIETHERRTLADDGQTMTVESTGRTPRGDRKSILVYQKES